MIRAAIEKHRTKFSRSFANRTTELVVNQFIYNSKRNDLNVREEDWTKLLGYRANSLNSTELVFECDCVHLNSLVSLNASYLQRNLLHLLIILLVFLEFLLLSVDYLEVKATDHVFVKRVH